MNTELDKVKSTITISLGTKNRLRELKGNKSYEDFINYLLRTRNELMHNNNTIEIQKFKRIKGIYKFSNYSILFSYNKPNNSPHFIFDISIETIRYRGNKIKHKHFLKKTLKISDKDEIQLESDLYFRLLTISINDSIDHLFKHKGRNEDHYLWKQEFETLNLPKSSFENDVIEKLNEFQSNIGVFS
jgi:hypothetical protein